MPKLLIKAGSVEKNPADLQGFHTLLRISHKNHAAIFLKQHVSLVACCLFTAHQMGNMYYTNDCFKLCVAACYPFGKTSCFSQNGRAI
jgi:hypothetical protein